MQKFHFISGLPRSGSTLLSAILRQNPEFSANITSPVGSLCTALLPKMSSGSEFSMYFSDEKRADILRGIFRNYYSEFSDKSAVFDTNRRWTARLALLEQLYPTSKVICCVRDIPWILDSLERAISGNPMNTSKLVGEKNGKTVYSRIESFMEPEDGIVGSAWSSLREAWFGQFSSKLVVVPYDRLASDPNGIMSSLYEVLKERPFPHVFDNIDFESAEYDLNVGTPGLHTVKSKVALERRTHIIPPDIVNRYSDTSFWLNSNLNTNAVYVL